MLRPTCDFHLMKCAIERPSANLVALQMGEELHGLKTGHRDMKQNVHPWHALRQLIVTDPLPLFLGAMNFIATVIGLDAPHRKPSVFKGMAVLSDKYEDQPTTLGMIVNPP